MKWERCVQCKRMTQTAIDVRMGKRWRRICLACASTIERKGRGHIVSVNPGQPVSREVDIAGWPIKES